MKTRTTLAVVAIVLAYSGVLGICRSIVLDDRPSLIIGLILLGLAAGLCAWPALKHLSWNSQNDPRGR